MIFDKWNPDMAGNMWIHPNEVVKLLQHEFY